MWDKLYPRKSKKENLPFTPFCCHTWRRVFSVSGLGNNFLLIVLPFSHALIWLICLYYYVVNARQQKSALFETIWRYNNSLSMQDHENGYHSYYSITRWSERDLIPPFKFLGKYPVESSRIMGWDVSSHITSINALFHRVCVTMPFTGLSNLPHWEGVSRLDTLSPSFPPSI